MHKAIGLITCASVMAVSLYLFSGGDPSRTLSAQTDSESGEGYRAVARRFLQDAREQARKAILPKLADWQERQPRCVPTGANPSSHQSSS